MTMSGERPTGGTKEKERRLRGWQAVTRGPIGTLPDFLILGAQKCGTTTLYDTLVQHPRVLPAFVKEVHFFDRYWNKGLLWYQANFPNRFARGRARLSGQPILSGDAAPSYLYHPLAPERARQVVPDARLIVLLRNPVDRAFSHYQMEFRRDIETLPFDVAVRTEEERLAGLEEVVRQGRHSHTWWHFSYKSRGHYADQLERWFAHFPREQFLIVKTEDYSADPAAVVQQVTGFFGLPDFDFGVHPRSNVGNYTEEMDPALRAELVEHFRPHNRRLEELLGRKFDWDR